MNDKTIKQSKQKAEIFVGVRFTPAEHANITKLAQACGDSKGGLIRRTMSDFYNLYNSRLPSNRLDTSQGK